MAITLQYPPLQRTPVSLKYRFNIDANTAPGLPSSSISFNIDLGSNFFDELTAGDFTLTVIFSDSTTQNQNIDLTTLQGYGHLNSIIVTFGGIVPPGGTSIVSASLSVTAFEVTTRPIRALVSIQRVGQPEGELIYRVDARLSHTITNDLVGYAKYHVNGARNVDNGTSVGELHFYPGLAFVDHDNFTLISGSWFSVTYDIQATDGYVPIPGRVVLDIRGMTFDEIRSYIPGKIQETLSLLLINYFWDGTKIIAVFATKLFGWYGNVSIINNVADNAHFEVVGFGGGTPPSIRVDALEGSLGDYFQSLLDTYYPANLANAITAITASTSIAVTLSGPGASICRSEWVQDFDYEDTSITLAVGLTATSGPSPTYVDVEIRLYGSDFVQDPITEVTTLGSILIARKTLGHVAFVPTHFAIGDYGYDPLIPQHPLLVNPDDTTLTHEIYRSPIERFDAPTDGVLSVVCRIPPSVVRCAVGEIGVFVTLTAVNNPVPLIPGGPTLNVGDVFLLGITHTGMRCVTYDQTDLHSMTFAL